MRNRMTKRREFLEKRADLFKQKNYLEKHFSFLTCKIDWRQWTLKCRGEIRSKTHPYFYEIELIYRPFKAPNVFIRKPKIPRKMNVHVYSNGSLCLYHSSEIKWNKKTMVYNTTIPRIAEWIMYYELWQLTREWEGPEYPHHANQKKK